MNVCNPKNNDEMQLKEIPGPFGYEVETLDPDRRFVQERWIHEGHANRERD
jgi:hypothetical protein